MFGLLAVCNRSRVHTHTYLLSTGTHTVVRPLDQLDIESDSTARAEYGGEAFFYHPGTKNL